jgi:hypothetical protein
VFGVGQSEGPEPCWLGYSDPDRSRCAEHGGSCKGFRSVPAPPRVVMLSPPEVPRNASRGQSEGPRERREKSAARGVIQAGAFGLGPGCLGCYSSSMKVISTLTLYPVMLPSSIRTF